MGSSRWQDQPSLAPSPEDIAWAAGFLEGEGTFWGNRNGSPSGHACLAATQKNPEPLEWLHAWFGGRIYFCKSMDRRSGTPQDIYKWQLSGALARQLMVRLLDCRMTQRRRGQIQKALDDDKSNPRGSEAYLAKRRQERPHHPPETRVKISAALRAYYANGGAHWRTRGEATSTQLTVPTQPDSSR